MKDSRAITLVTTVVLVTALTACAPYRPAPGKAAMCNQLNSQMVFGSNTSDTRRSEIQDAEAPMIARTYEKNNCI